VAHDDWQRGQFVTNRTDRVSSLPSVRHETNSARFGMTPSK
jgi:hypothetical protein